MYLEWTKDLSTNIIWIDKQHKIFFKKMDDFLVATCEGKGDIESITALTEIEDYANIHFGTEEKYMLQYSYPNYKIQKAQHEKYKITFEGLRAKFSIEGASKDFLREFQIDIIEWYKNHVKKLDQEFADFLREKKLF